MSKPKTYVVASNKTMTVKEIETATGVSAKKIRVQLTVKGIACIRQAVRIAAMPEQEEAVEKLFETVKAKASVKPSKKKGRENFTEQRVVVDLVNGTYTIVRRAEDTDKYKKGTIQAFNGKAANSKNAIKGSMIKFLKSVIAEKNLPIKLVHSKKSSMNTRQLGKDVINALV